MQVATQGQLGIVETIMSRGLCGMAYAALAGQPMTFIGPTGLTLTFTTALYVWSAPRGLPFLPLYAWVGLWTAAFLMVAACVNLAGLIRYCTRFTEEVFNAFLGTTYIWTAVSSLAIALVTAAAAAAVGAPTAASAAASGLLSLVLGLSAFTLCEASCGLATSRYFSPALRNLVADFGPAAAVAAVSAFSVTAFARHLAEVPRLALPASGAISLGRPLLVPLLSLSLGYRLLAALPAFFLAILFFLDQNITVRTVNSPVNKLLPRATYHLDLFVLGLLTGITSLCGLPWMCAATVESINHVRSMTQYDLPRPSDVGQPGPLAATAGAADSDSGFPDSPAGDAAAQIADSLRKEFDDADIDGNGALSADEIVQILRAPDAEGKQLPSDVAARQAADVLRRYDYSVDGKLQFEEYVAWRSPPGETDDPTASTEAASSAAGSAAAPPGSDEKVIETRLSGFLVHAAVLGWIAGFERQDHGPPRPYHEIAPAPPSTAPPPSLHRPSTVSLPPCLLKTMCSVHRSTLSFVSRLRAVPIAVVHGVFLYLGQKVMSGNQFLQRLRALAVPLPTNLDTETESERSILVLGRKPVAMFTGLQLACLCTLWALKLQPALGMIFPAAIGILMFIRAQLLPRLFSRRELSVIDTPIWSIRAPTVSKRDIV